MQSEPNNASSVQLWTRRAFLRRAGSAALGGAALSLILAACGGSAAPTSSSPASTPASGAASPPASAAAPASSAAVPASQAPASASAAASVPASAAAPASGAAPTGTLKVADADFATESMDPIIGQESAWAFTFADTFLTHDANGNYVGKLADSWDVSPDGTTWTFHLHKGVKFQNGDPMTAQDVLFSFQHFGDKKSTNPWSPYIIADAADISATDDNTVVYKLKAPEWAIREPMAIMRILPKSYFEKLGEDGWAKAPIGTGAYKLTNYTPKQSVTFQAVPDYWYKTKPSFAQVIHTLVPDQATRVAQLERGEVDIIGNIDLDTQLQLQSKGYRLQPFGAPTQTNISFSGTWMTKGPTSDIRVRQAMSYAINRQEIAQTYLKGLGKPGGYWFWYDKTWGYDVDPKAWSPDTAEQLKYDPAKAKQLLQAANYPAAFTPQTITMYVNAVQSDISQILQGYWQKVGINVDIKPVDTSVYFGLIFQRAKQATDQVVGSVWPWTSGSFFNNVYHSANMFTSVGVHTTGNDPKADQMYQDAVHQADENTAKQKWSDMMKYAYNNMWINVPVIEYPSNLVVSKNVGSIDPQYAANGFGYEAGVRPAS